jgi:hypothetical protein
MWEVAGKKLGAGIRRFYPESRFYLQGLYSIGARSPSRIASEGRWEVKQ